jgi:O-antigen ligase
MTSSKLLFVFPLLFFFSTFIAGGELVWAQAVVAVLLYPIVLSLVGGAVLFKRTHIPRFTISQLVFLSALLFLCLLAEIQGNSLIGWSVLKADSLRHSATTWLLLAYSLFCIWVVRNRDDAVWVIGSLAVVALLNILFGVAILASGSSGYILHGEYNAYQHLMGGFFNKNSFGAFLNLALFSVLGLYVRQLSYSTPAIGEGWRKIMRSVTDFFVSSSTRLLFVAGVFWIALIASYGRAATGLSFVGAALFFTLCLVFLDRASRELKSKLKFFLSIFVLVIVVAVMSYLAITKMSDSSLLDDRTTSLALQAAEPGASPSPESDQDFADSDDAFIVSGQSQYQDTVFGRIQPALDGIAAIKDRYWLGIGANNFQWVFMQHRTEKSTDGYYKYAHSDGIQFLIESGIVGLILYGTILIVPLISGFRVLFNPVRSTGTKCLVIGCIVGLLMVFLHSFIDFPFQIFGVVLPAVTLLNLLMILAMPTGE